MSLLLVHFQVTSYFYGHDIFSGYVVPQFRSPFAWRYRENHEFHVFGTSVPSLISGQYLK